MKHKQIEKFNKQNVC